MKTATKLCVASAIALFAFGLTGCNAVDSSTAPADDTTPEVGAPADVSDENSGEGDDDRAFDSTDDATIKAIDAALSPDDIKWEGKSLKAYFNEGSVEDPMASVGCLALQTLIADDETGFKVYSDGEIDCSDIY